MLEQTGEKKKKLNRNRSCSHHTASSSGYETNPRYREIGFNSDPDHSHYFFSPADSNERINSADNSP